MREEDTKSSWCWRQPIGDASQLPHHVLECCPSTQCDNCEVVTVSRLPSQSLSAVVHSPHGLAMVPWQPLAAGYVTPGVDTVASGRCHFACPSTNT